MENVCSELLRTDMLNTGGSRRGGGRIGGQGFPPPLFFLEDPETSWRGEKALHVCVRMQCVLVVNSHPDPPFPQSCIHPWSPSIIMKPGGIGRILQSEKGEGRGWRGGGGVI